jgi:hypothetical protein
MSMSQKLLLKKKWKTPREEATTLRGEREMITRESSNGV